MYCSKCGKELSGKEKFCPKCGNVITENVSQEAAKNQRREENQIGKKNSVRKTHRGRNLILFGLCLGVLILGGVSIYNFILSRQYEYLAVVQNQEGKYGYINEKGREVIACEYDIAYSFNENGIAAVGNKNGRIYEENSEIYDLYDWKLIDSKGKELAILDEYDAVAEEGVFSDNGFLAVGKMISEAGDDFFEWGYIDENGDEVLKCQYYKGYFPQDMDIYGRWNKEGMTCILDKNENCVILNEEGATPFSIPAEKSIDIALADLLEEEGIYSAAKQISTDEEGDPIYEYGYVDKTGKEIIPYQFTDAGIFSENGLAAVEKGDKWGYIDKSGETIIPFQFDAASVFSENGLANVTTVEGKEGYINADGELVIELDSYVSSAFDFIGSIAVIYNSNYDCGLIDLYGNEVMPCRYKAIYNAGRENFMIVGQKTEGELYQYGCVNDKGEMVIPLQYDYLSGFGRNGWMAAGIKTGSLNESIDIYSVDYLNESGEVELELPTEYISGNIFMKVK